MLCLWHFVVWKYDERVSYLNHVEDWKKVNNNNWQSAVFEVPVSSREKLWNYEHRTVATGGPRLKWCHSKMLINFKTQNILIHHGKVCSFVSSLENWVVSVTTFPPLFDYLVLVIYLDINYVETSLTKVKGAGNVWSSPNYS